MRDNTTLIILTRNCEKKIEGMISLLSTYCKKYHNIQEVIIGDNASEDETPKNLEAYKTNKIQLILYQKKNKKKLFLECIGVTNTPLIVTLEPDLNTRLHQLQRQIKKLRKTDLLLLNRLDKESLVRFKSKTEELKIKTRNLIIRILARIQYEDLTNENKAFKKDKLEPILKKTKSKRRFWVEAIKRCEKKGIKISQSRTHYIQEEKKKEDKLLLFFKEVKELLKIRKI